MRFFIDELKNLIFVKNTSLKVLMMKRSEYGKIPTRQLNDTQTIIVEAA